MLKISEKTCSQRGHSYLFGLLSHKAPPSPASEKTEQPLKSSSYSTIFTGIQFHCSDECVVFPNILTEMFPFHLIAVKY